MTFSEVNLPELILPCEHSGGFEDVFAQVLTAFHPGAAAEAHADIRAVRNFQRSDIPIEIAKDAAWHAAKVGHGRVIRMDSDSDTDSSATGTTCLMK